MIDKNDILQALAGLHMDGATICVHGSLKSFGPIDGGVEMLVSTLNERNRTIVVPTFFYRSIVRPPADIHYLRNGSDPSEFPVPGSPDVVPYKPDKSHIEKSMGIIPAHLLAQPEAIRGDHPINSFAAIGPEAYPLMSSQTPIDAYAPYRKLETCDNAWIILMGVGLNRATPVHFGEVLAGRHLFRVWAQTEDGTIVETCCGSCSDGFPKLDSHVCGIETRIVVGDSVWRVFRFNDFVRSIANVIKSQPDITHCDNPDCQRCNDMVAGGPMAPSKGNEK